MTVLPIPYSGGPIETGHVMLGQQPGLFIRGDEAQALATALRNVARRSNAQRYDMTRAMDLLRLLQACDPQTGYRL